MDTDLLDFSSADSAANSGELYSDVMVTGRPAVPSSTGSVGTYGKLTAVADKVEPVTASPPQPVNPQAAIPLTAAKPDPPVPHSIAAHSAHYKSPGSVSDGVSSSAVDKPRPDIPQKSTSVPAIPPRKPRYPIPGRPDALLSKSTQPQPPLPPVSPVSRKSSEDSFNNRTYGVSMVENRQRCSVTANSNPPPVPIPRNTVAVGSEAARVPASTNAMTVSSNSPVPCDSTSSGEQVSKYLDVLCSLLIVISL